MRKKIYTTILLAVAVVQLFAQGTDITGKNNFMFIKYNFSPVKSQIKYNNSKAGSIQQSGETNIFHELELGMFISKRAGASVSVSTETYNSTLKLSTYNANFQATDAENEVYEMRVNGSDIEEIEKMTSFTVGLNLFYNQPITRSITAYISGGLNIVKPFKSTYTGTGTFSYAGYFSAYNLLITDVPDYGFAFEHPTYTKGNLDMPLSFSYNLSAGLCRIIDSKFAVGLGFTLKNSFTSAAKSQNNYRLTSGMDNYNSIYYSTEKVVLTSIGGQIFIRYFIR